MKIIATIFLFIFSMVFLSPSVSALCSSEKVTVFNVNEEKNINQPVNQEEIKKECAKIFHPSFALNILANSCNYNNLNIPNIFTPLTWA